MKLKKKSSDAAAVEPAVSAEKEEKKEKKPQVPRTVLNVLPIRSYDDNLEAFRLSDKSYMDIMQIIPRDLRNIADDELDAEIYNFLKILRTVGCDLKLISVKFPLNLEQQKKIHRHHMDNAGDEVRLKWLERQYREMETAEAKVSTLYFYLAFFGKNRDEFIKNKEDVMKYAGIGQWRLAEEISYEQKLNICNKLNNMNTLVDLYAAK